MYAGCNGLIRALVGEAWFVPLYFPFLCPFTVLCPSAVQCACAVYAVNFLDKWSNFMIDSVFTKVLALAK